MRTGLTTEYRSNKRSSLITEIKMHFMNTMNQLELHHKQHRMTLKVSNVTNNKNLKQPEEDHCDSFIDALFISHKLNWQIYRHTTHPTLDYMRN